jgi:phage repressor protein C with HTH and peptisase S24 domain
MTTFLSPCEILEPKTVESIQAIIEAKGLKNNVFAKKIGISAQNLSGMLSGRRSVGEALIYRISQAFGLSYDAVKYGIGLDDQLKAQSFSPDSAKRVLEREMVYEVQRRERADAGLTWNDDGHGVPFYDVDVFAGDVVAFNDFNTQPVSYLQMPGVADCDFSCRLSGNSMQEKILPGAILVCREVRDRQIIAFGEIHLIVTKEQRLVKYLRKNRERPGWYILKSHNPEYDDIDVPAEEILRLFLVKFVINQQQL